MGQWYNIGLQAGKKVAEAVDAFIKAEHKGDTLGLNFDPEKRKTLSDGTTVYKWSMKWAPSFYKDEGRFVEVLKGFDDNKLPFDDLFADGTEEYGYKLVAVGDEGGQDKMGNSIGYEIFDGLYNACEVTYPDEFSDESGMSKQRIIELFKSYINNDLSSAEPGYVRNVLRDTCGCTDDELRELELYYELGFNNAEEEVS